MASPIEIYNKAHDRATLFVGRNQNKRKFDDLRAAIIFEVAAIDAFFKVKVVNILRKQRNNAPSKFKLHDFAQGLAREMASRETFEGKGYTDLNNREKKAIKLACTSSDSEVITYLQGSFSDFSFQNVKNLDEGLKMMGRKPNEIWGKVLNIRKAKPKGTKNINIKELATGQLASLFKRRHKIVHEADLFLWSKPKHAKQRTIKIETVRDWLKVSSETIEGVNKLIQT